MMQKPCTALSVICPYSALTYKVHTSVCERSRNLRIVQCTGNSNIKELQYRYVLLQINHREDISPISHNFGGIFVTFSRDRYQKIDCTSFNISSSYLYLYKYSTYLVLVQEDILSFYLYQSWIFE